MNADELLGDLDALRRRTRADRRGYAFPLFLFGALILLAPLTYVTELIPVVEGEFQLMEVAAERGPFPQFVPRFFFDLFVYPELIGWYWVLTIIGGLAATHWWYRRRARRFGVEGDTRLLVVGTGTALLGFLFFSTVLEIVSHRLTRSGLYSTPDVNLPLMFGSAAVAAIVLAWGSRPRRTERARTASVFAGGLFAALAFAALAVYMIYGFSALLVIAVALLALAWSERSVLLGVVGLLFAGVSLVVNLYSVENLYYDLGWYVSGGRLLALQYLLVPGLVLLAGGAVAALSRRGRAQ
jgi:hypothetical protein